MLRDGMEALSWSVDAVVRLPGGEGFRHGCRSANAFIVRGQCHVTRGLGHCARASGTLPERIAGGETRSRRERKAVSAFCERRATSLSGPRPGRCT